MNPRRSALGIPSRGRRRAARAPRAGIASALVVAIGVVAIGLAGCAPGPAPKPTPTPLFTSEADAFKAAEQVYRDYNDASNSRRDGKAGVDPQRFLAGQALEDDINARRSFEEKHLRVVGPNRVSSFDPIDYDQARGQVSANLCIDVTESHVVDEAGNDVTQPSRTGLVALHVILTEQRAHLAITSAIAGTHSCQG